MARKCPASHRLATGTSRCDGHVVACGLKSTRDPRKTRGGKRCFEGIGVLLAWKFEWHRRGPSIRSRKPMRPYMGTTNGVGASKATARCAEYSGMTFSLGGVFATLEHRRTRREESGRKAVRLALRRTVVVHRRERGADFHGKLAAGGPRTGVRRNGRSSPREQVKREMPRRGPGRGACELPAVSRPFPNFRSRRSEMPRTDIMRNTLVGHDRTELRKPMPFPFLRRNCILRSIARRKKAVGRDIRSVGGHHPFRLLRSERREKRRGGGYQVRVLGAGSSNPFFAPQPLASGQFVGGGGIR